MIPFKKLSLASVFLIAFASGVFPEEESQALLKKHEKNLYELEKKIEALEKDKSNLKKDERNLTQEIDTLDQTIKSSLNKQHYYSRKALSAFSEVENLGNSIKTYQSKEEQNGKQLLASLVGYHMNVVYPQRIHPNYRVNYLMRKQILDDSGRMIEAKEAKLSTIEEQNEKIKLQQDLEKKRADWQKKLSEERKEKLEKKRVYSSLLKKKELTESELKQSEESKAQLEDFIVQLRKKAHIAGGIESSQARRTFFLSEKGSLVWPVKGEIVSKFGRQKHSSLNIVTINNGIRIKTAGRSEVKTIEAGKVIFASNFKTYGLTIIVDHGGDFYSIYGLLSDLKVEKGNEIAKGQVIGKIESNEEPQLYFEIRNGGIPENPLDWLQ